MGIFLGLFKRYAKKKSQVPTLHQWGLGEVQNGSFFQKTGPKSPHHEEKKNLKPPYVDNRFQNYDLHSRCKGNSKFSVFPSFTSCQIQPSPVADDHQSKLLHQFQIQNLSAECLKMVPTLSQKCFNISLGQNSQIISSLGPESQIVLLHNSIFFIGKGRNSIAPKKLLPEYLHISIFNISALLWELCVALVRQ